MPYTDEPILVRPARRPLGRTLAIIAVALLVALFAYIPWQKHHMQTLAESAPRGARGGASYPITLNGQPHQLSLGWVRGPVFAISCTPPPPPGTTLHLKASFGEETLDWNPQLNAYGPGTHTINPREHYQLTLNLLAPTNTPLWTDTLWAYGALPNR